MAFGTQITNITRDSIGYFGYILKINSADLLAYSIDAVQAQVDTYDTPVPYASEVTKNTLYGYLNDESCPLLAFNHSNGELSIFCKGTGSDVPAVVVTTEYAINDYVRVSNRVYKCITSGITENPTPAYPTSGNVTDGTAIFQFVANVPIPDSIPYLSTSRIAVFGKRNAQNTTSDSDLLDVPDKDIELVKAYALENAFGIAKNGYIPKWIKDRIKDEERRLRND